MRARPWPASVALPVLLVIALAVLGAACTGGRTVKSVPAPSGTTDISQLWQEPADLETRDLMLGPAASAPKPEPPAFIFVKADPDGFSPGYDLKDQNGLEWSVKLGPEAQTEVVVSRILWAIGYHQLPTYYLTQWTMEKGPDGVPGPGRFRPHLPNAKVAGEWSWHENPFVHTQPFRGLIVANLIVNNWDWKTSNNKIYDITSPDGTVVRQYVVRDLGASLGKIDAPVFARVLGARVAQGNRNDLEDFEQQRLIKSVTGDRIEFEYNGIYGTVVDTVTPDDVVWACRLLSRLSDEQWKAAFTAGGFPPDQAARFIAKLKSKIAEGLALANRTR
ncbi:MAG TPA: hypothetical protein VM846_20200 [Vicinamibacterales bacterium]|jgi:hypothetical protein|nr:hypothetical protein [Vicinamibacterales bacterium]